MNKDSQNKNSLPRISKKIKVFLGKNIFFVMAILLIAGSSTYMFFGDFESKKPIVGLLGYHLGSNISDAKNINGKSWHSENRRMKMTAFIKLDETKPSQEGYIKYSKYTNEIFEIGYTLKFKNKESCYATLSSLKKELRDYYITDNRFFNDEYSFNSRTVKTIIDCSYNHEFTVVAVDEEIKNSIKLAIEKNNVKDTNDEIKKGNELINNILFKEKS
jgi:hypothetical protein